MFDAVLTGTPDLPLDLSNVALTMRPAYTFMRVSVNPGLVQEIAARSSGELVLYRTIDGTRSEVKRVNYNGLRSDEGGNSRSLSLSGTTTVGYTTGSVSLFDVVSDDILADGRRQLVVSAANDVVPGDTVTWNGTPTVIGTVQLNAGAGGITQTLSEV